MNGSVNSSQKAKNLVDNVNSLNIVVGTPGSWSVSLPHAVAAAQMAVAGPGAGAGTGPLSPGDAATVQSAVAQSNAAASATPSAASGQPTTANTAVSIINSTANGLTSIASTPANLKQLEAGATATLNWWGWDLKLNESGTQALEALLTTDVAGLVAIATALAAFSAPLAAAAAIVSAVSTGLNGWVSSEDSAHNGVDICGYLWVGVWVTAA